MNDSSRVSSFFEELNSEIEKASRNPLNSSQNSLLNSGNYSWEDRVMPDEDKHKFSKYFFKADLDRDGFIPFNVVMKLFAKSQLPIEELNRIWKLCSYRGDSKLDCDEFVLGLYLIKCYLNGETLPKIIPDSLKPKESPTTRFNSDFYMQIPSTKNEEEKPSLYQPISAIPPEEEKNRKFSAGTTGVLKRDLFIERNKAVIPGIPSYRVCVVGDPVGKSSIISRFLYDEYTEEEDPTVEDIFEVNYEDELSRTTTHLQILDTSGNDDYIQAMEKNWFHGKDGYVLVYSIESRSSFQKIMSFRSRIVQISKSESTPMVVVGTKKDLKNRSVPSQEAEYWAYRFGYPHIECSAKTGENIEGIWRALTRVMRAQENKQPHSWKKESFPALTPCCFCNIFIWSMESKHGLVCKECRQCIHILCMNRVPQNCGTMKSVSKNRCTEVQLIEYITENELESSLRNDDTRFSFLKFLQQKQSGFQEVMFWTEAEEYREIKSRSKRVEKGTLIYNTFFFVGNIYDFKIPEKILKKLKKDFDSNNFEPNMFEEAQRLVLKQIRMNHFPDFVRTKFYREMLFTDDESDSTTDATWYFGSISRSDTERLLLESTQDSFLVRTSSIKGSYALSQVVGREKVITHWMICPDEEGGYYIKDCPLDNRHYNSLKELVNNCAICDGLRPVGKPRKTRLTISQIRRRPKLTTLEEVLRDEDAYVSFKHFLKIGLCGENLEFLEEVKNFKNIPTEERAQNIKTTFIDNGSPSQLNLDAEIVGEIYEKMKNGIISKQLFSTAEEFIYNLMEQDSLPKFLSYLERVKSESFQQLQMKFEYLANIYKFGF